LELFLKGFCEAINLLLSGDDGVYSAIMVSVSVSSYSLFTSLFLGIPLGFCLGYFRFPGQRILRTIVDTLLALPTVFIGLMVYTMLSRSGPLGELGLLFTVKAIAVGQVILGLPIIMALTAAQVESLDRRIRETLMGLGASPRDILLATVQEARFGIMAAAVAAYGRILTEVGISMMVGGNIKYHTRTITTAIALETGKGEFVTGIALGIVLLVIALLVNTILSFIKRRWQ